MQPKKPNPNRREPASPNRRPSGQKANNRSGQSANKARTMITGTGRSVSRGAAIRAQKRTIEDANRIASQYQDASAQQQPQRTRRANAIDDTPRLKIIGLGGMDNAGSKNMMVIEYKDDAIIIDCGNDLSVDLPGINYGIADSTYLEQIKPKIKAFVMTHGHLDHIGGLPHILPKYNVPVYGTRFTIGMVEKIFGSFGVPMPDGFELNTVIMNETTHERLKIGEFFVELVRVTHAIPGSTAVVVDTPVGRVINTGDFRLDPDPLDHERTDTDRLKELGKEGVLLLMSESTSADRAGRTPSEQTIQPTFVDIFTKAPGRVFVSLFSSNMNRTQMVVNAAVANGRKVAFDGRSLVSTLELSVRLGLMKIPKGQVIPMSAIGTLPDNEVVVICTGSQGEPNSALQRMSNGEHRDIKLKEQDSVVLSSTPIPESGNDALIGVMVDDFVRKGVHVYRHVSHDLDGCGPLHVSGHASLDEYGEMIDMVKPKFFLPIYGSIRAKKYHIDRAVEHGIPRKSTLNIENGEVVTLTPDVMEIDGRVPHGTILVDQTGAIVSNIVVKDRVLLAEEGLVAVVLTIDKKTGQLLTSPDIISRGFIYMKDNEELMNNFRTELRRAVTQRFKRVELDRFKAELRDYVTHFLYEQTQHSPIVIPVVNVIGGGRDQQSNGNNNGKAVLPGASAQQRSPEEVASDQQRRFAQMRQQLLNQDARVD